LITIFQHVAPHPGEQHEIVPDPPQNRDRHGIVHLFQTEHKLNTAKHEVKTVPWDAAPAAKNLDQFHHFYNSSVVSPIFKTVQRTPPC